MTKDIMDLVQQHWEKQDWEAFNECRLSMKLPTMTFEEYQSYNNQLAEDAAKHPVVDSDDEEIWNYIPQFKNTNQTK